ncbi:MAG: glucose-1-phosphate adenylyltransferase [Chlamydiales bacterium]|nr:glucose-1-phosphate adenylyltransferase [Chlamydiales bacterium]
MLINYTSQAVEKTAPSIPLDRICVIVLGGGKGSRLDPLTKTRCKPAVSFGGRYSLIDVPISHSLSSGLTNIYVIGQYLAYSLHNHLSRTYLNYGVQQNRIQMLVPEERDGQKIWYKGTADAVRQNLHYFADIAADYFLILSGDQLYNINFHDMVDFGVQTDASMVVATQPVNATDAKRMGLLKLAHGSSQLIDFFEKPKSTDEMERFYTDEFTLHRLGFEASQGQHYLGSMGIYLFKRQALFELLREDPRDDFGKHLITTEMEKGTVHGYLYDGYWEDIGTIESYYKANLALAHPCTDFKRGLNCYDERSLIITKSHDLPGAQISNCSISNVLLCEGSVIRASKVHNSVVGIRNVIGEGCQIQESVLLGNEYYERAPLYSGDTARIPGIGENTLISKAIIDENVTIGNNVRLVNEAGHREFDSPDGRVFVRDGIIIVPRGAHIPSNYKF